VQSRTPGYPTILNMFIELVLWNRNWEKWKGH
jgi:hypothetical protein